MRKRVNDLVSKITVYGAECLKESEQKLADRLLTVGRRGKNGKTRVTINTGACNQAINDAGIFVLVSNCVKDSSGALKWYRRRELIESGCRTGKTDFDGANPGVWSAAALRGREFRSFIALCCQREFLRRLE